MIKWLLVLSFFLIRMEASASAIKIGDFKVDNRVKSCFHISILKLKDDSLSAGRHVHVSLFLESKRLKDNGSTGNEWLDVNGDRENCCPKYTFPYALVKDSRGKNYSTTLITRPDDVGDIAETQVSISKLVEDADAKPPYKLVTKCQ